MKEGVLIRKRDLDRDPQQRLTEGQCAVRARELEEHICKPAIARNRLKLERARTLPLNAFRVSVATCQSRDFGLGAA